jgi:hypothetical protein
VVADFARYAAWNPTFVHVEGEARDGARLTLRLQLGEGGRLWRMRARIVRLEPPHALCWRARLLVPGLLDRRHCVHLESSGDDTRVVRSEEFAGVLAPLLPRSLYERLQQSLDAMSEALKERVERPARKRADAVPETVEAG